MIFISGKIKKLLGRPYIVLLIIFSYTFVFGLFVDSPQRIIEGMYSIVSTRSVLITDYAAVGGLGATLVNVSVTSLLILLMYKLLQLKPNGSILVAFWLCAGFSFFGKNLLNTIPIILGGYLYSVYKKENFMRYSLPAVLSTTLAPVVNEVFLANAFNNFWLNLILAIAVGVAVGFIMVPISANAIKAHAGFNLYNVGFAAGILAVFISGTLKALGLQLPARSSIWSSNYQLEFAIYLVSICIFLIFVGVYLSEDIKPKMQKIMRSPGRLVTDFYMLFKEVSYINMGINGLFSLLVIFLIGAKINGPTVGAIFTIIGFGCYGKHINNMWPLMVGAILATIVSDKSLTEPAIVLAILFCTGLAPVAGTFGKKEGILTGVIHLFISTNVSFLYGGLNLYNNGFAAGLVAMIVVPLIAEFKFDLQNRKEEML